MYESSVMYEDQLSQCTVNQLIMADVLETFYLCVMDHLWYARKCEICLPLLIFICLKKVGCKKVIKPKSGCSSGTDEFSMN